MAVYNVQRPATAGRPFTGDVVGVTFTDDRATVDSDMPGNAGRLLYFRRHGYLVEEPAVKSPAVKSRASKTSQTG